MKDSELFRNIIRCQAFSFAAGSPAFELIGSQVFYMFPDIARFKILRLKAGMYGKQAITEGDQKQLHGVKSKDFRGRDGLGKALF
jgi:hypothetical protein